MRKKYQSVLLLLLLTLLLMAAVMYWYNRKIEGIERKMRDEPELNQQQTFNSDQLSWVL